MIKKLLHALENYLLTKTCLFCHTASNNHIDLCLPCRADLPWAKQTCVRCANLLPDTLPDILRGELICGECLVNPPPFTQTHTLFHYQEPIANIITAFKFHKKLAAGRVLSQLMLETLAPRYLQLPDVVIPVPLHKTRLRERGYNQALELAKPLTKKLAIPLDYLSCVRSKATVPQTQIPADQRLHNVKDAFTVLDPAIKDKHIAIVDDVVTTGHTVRALSETLLRQGARRVDVWCCAKTQLPKK